MNPIDAEFKRGDRAREYLAPIGWVLVAIPVETWGWLRLRLRMWWRGEHV